jgi:hypothetical protein
LTIWHGATKEAESDEMAMTDYDYRPAVAKTLEVARKLRGGIDWENMTAGEAEALAAGLYAAGEEAGHRHTEQTEDAEPTIGGDHATHTKERGA